MIILSLTSVQRRQYIKMCQALLNQPIVGDEEWFEICFTHLIHKFEEKLPFIGTQQPYYALLMQRVFHGGHPVDYLYSLYNELK